MSKRTAQDLINAAQAAEYRNFKRDINNSSIHSKQTTPSLNVSGSGGYYYFNKEGEMVFRMIITHINPNTKEPQDISRYHKCLPSEYKNAPNWVHTIGFHNSMLDEIQSNDVLG